MGRMPQSPLADYFSGDKLLRALSTYAEEMVDPGWPVTPKMELYDAAFRAYDPAVSEANRFEAFTTIYAALSSREWGAFRPVGAANCWRPRRIYDTISNKLADFSPTVQVHLRNFQPDRRAALVSAMQALQGIKPVRGYPTMTASKFLHFFNPGLFPIWDNAVIDQRVFKRFGGDYESFCASIALDPSAVGAEFLGNYICWASRCVVDAGERFMPTFIEWLRDEIPPRRFRALDSARLPSLYAVAFEFTIIGAAITEGA